MRFSRDWGDAVWESGWERVSDPSDDDAAIHILPLNDLFDHVESASCACRPTVEQHPGYRPVIAHTAWDGRAGDRPILH